ncbi:MAG: hypothetical protein MUP26_08290 [Desulfobulbaceae bacterium]|nr:hypothetical protein [Desulfobulbaceae bacterium]
MNAGERIIEEICKQLDQQKDRATDALILWKLRGLSEEELKKMINIKKTRGKRGDN